MVHCTVATWWWRREFTVLGSRAPPRFSVSSRSERNPKRSRTRSSHADGSTGYCSRDLVAEACPYAKTCELCDNFVTTTELAPALQDQLADIRALHADANERSWNHEAARHARVIESIDSHLRRLQKSD